MKGLPIHQLSNSAKGMGLVETKASAHADAAGVVVEGEKANDVKGEFSSLFAKLVGKDSKKSSEVKSQVGETLKNLLEEKKSEKEQVQTIDGKAVIDPKFLLNTKDGSQESVIKGLLQKKEKISDGDESQAIDQKIAQTNGKLDQLLNNLKGTEDHGEHTEAHTGKSNTPSKEVSPWQKGDIPKGELKTESPLDFLMKGVKEKEVSEKKLPEMNQELVLENSHESEKSQPPQMKVMTAEDFINNKQSAEKKAPILALLNGKKEMDLDPNRSKGIQSNAKNYGQGLALLNDTMIKNTRDLTSKDEKKVKNSDLSINELQSKETKVGAELSNIKQDIVIGVSGNKHNQSQENIQTSANQKVLDLSEIQTSNTNEIIKRISDYVEQNQVANKQSLDLNVKHESLGEFKIQVSKMPESMNRGLNQIDMQITTSSKEGHEFFVKNEVSLIKNLNQAGINLSDLRIVSRMTESGAFGQTDSRQSSSFNQSADGSSKQFMNFESNSFSSNSGAGNGAERRKELWEEYQQRYGA